MYDFRSIEAKWQSYYERKRPFAVDLEHAPKPFINLMMFPYPSAGGLHIGNMFSFIGSDVYGRYKKLQGYDVYEPIGFDAFGIHSENYALRLGENPSRLTPKSIEFFREEQLKKIGTIMDWNSEINTTQPEYYRWTQWIFLQLYKAGLAEKRMSEVNWCPCCKTVLADEQVIDGECERCSNRVEQRRMSQWFFTITQYADRLLDNLERLDWTDVTRNLQKSWIGRSAGATISFPVEQSSDQIQAFTTRPDTVFGVTFMAIAPEYPGIESLVSEELREQLDAFIQKTQAMDEVERTSIKREKTGLFLGRYVIHPYTGERIPLWVGDYVLARYGSGAVMGVPAHDERDYAFAKKYGLQIRKVIACADSDLPYGALGEMIDSGPFSGWKSEEFIERVEETHPDTRKAITYHLHDWCISRQRYWGPPIPIIYCDACGIVPVPEEDLPVLLPLTDDFVPDGSGKSPLARNETFVNTTCPTCGGSARRETDVNDNFLDSAWYYLRYASPKDEDVPFREEIIQKWYPVDMYIGGNEHAMLHLMYARFIAMALSDLGIIPFEEPFPHFRGHGMIVRDGSKMAKSKGNMVIPNDYFDSHGVDCLRTYLMFMGNFMEGGDFRDGGMDAIKRFLSKVWDLAQLPQGRSSQSLIIKMARTIERFSHSVEHLKYNVAIAALMEFVNEAGKEESIEKLLLLDFARMLSLFAPFLAEEIHSGMGESGTILNSGYPEGYDQYLATADIELPVQIQGKHRLTLTIHPNATQGEIMEAIQKEPRLFSQLDGKSIVKVIYVPGKIINLILGKAK